MLVKLLGHLSKPRGGPFAIVRLGGEWRKKTGRMLRRCQCCVGAISSASKTATSIKTVKPAAAPAIPLFRQANFLLFSLARVGSRAGAQVMAVAVGWQLYALTGSALDLGLVALAEFLPSLVLMLAAGQVADRFGRRAVSRTAQFVQAALAIAFAMTSAAGGVTPAFIYGLVVALGIARAFEAPALQALLPDMVSARDLPRAIAASSAAMQCALVVAPVIGGLAFAAGATLAYGLGAVLFAVAALAMSVLAGSRGAARQAQTDRVTRHSVLAGLRHVRGSPVLLGALTLDFLIVLLGGVTVLLPVFARDLLDAGPGGLGLLRAAPGVGALVVSLWLANRSLGGAVGHKMFGAAAVFGVATVVLGVSESFALSLVALAVLGAADMLGAVIRATLVQLETPEAMRGRVAAVNALVAGSSNQLGDIEAGLTAAWFGTRQAVVLGGVGALVACALWARWFPALYRRDRM